MAGTPYVRSLLREHASEIERTRLRLISLRTFFQLCLRLLAERPPARGEQRTFILPADSPGSLGDEAMVRSVFSVGERDGTANLLVINPRGGTAWPGIARLHQCYLPWLYERYPIGRKRFTASVGPRDHFVWLAADTIDGGHDDFHLRRTVAVLHLWADRGAMVSVVNFSLRAGCDMAAETVRLLERAEHVVVRDELSASSLRRQTGRPFMCAPDVAYALLDDVSADVVAADAPAVVGVNVSGHAVEKEAQADLAHIVGQGLADLHGDLPELVFELIPHDIKPGKGDDRTPLRELATVLVTAGVGCSWAPALETAALRGRLHTVSIVFTARMHLAIAALTCGKVPVCLTYFGGKFAGQTDLFGLPRWLLISAGEATTADVHAVMVRALAERVALEQLIQAALPDVRRAAIDAVSGYLARTG